MFVGQRNSRPVLPENFGDEKQLACPVGGPWPANVVLLTLTQPLPTEPRKEISRADTLPWALELANGQRCTLMTGAMPPVAGMRIIPQELKALRSVQ
jgi:hypothetical protein